MYPNLLFTIVLVIRVYFVYSMLRREEARISKRVDHAVHKNKYVSGKAAGLLKKGATGFFFSFLQILFSSKTGQYFPTKKKKVGKKKKLRPPNWL